MLYQINDGTVTVGGTCVLSHINFEIHGTEKIAVVGRNGAGKTTLLRLIAGELTLDRDDKRAGAGVSCSRKITTGMLSQHAFLDAGRTVEEELLSACPCQDPYARERFEYEQEYDRLFTGLGFKKEDKRKKLSGFSGGEQTKIALIRLLLLKPDILLLDEPTNHLDMETCQWLEKYMAHYEKAVVMVSHDRFFLDQTAHVVYELEGKRLARYPGNYSQYKKEKQKKFHLQSKAYERQQEEIRRLEELIERFKHKPNKAAFARAKRKAIERMDKVPKPEMDDAHIFTGEITPLISGSKWVFESEHLKIGYGKPLLEITMRIKKGQKIGILGPNGAGKTTFLKTLAGLLPALNGEYSLGNNITIGYFDQLSAQLTSDKQVVRHFHDLFPSLTEKEVRSVLGAYLFDGKTASKPVSSLSGGEKARLCLAELLQSRPNFLILDEPTNHMDIQAKETLESAFLAYTGTILFVSHDRYFIRQVADAILIFENQSVMYYPFGYEHYLERCCMRENGESLSARIKAEEQALIAGMKAVPKAERHRLKEVSTEDAYLDWQLKLAHEKMEEAQGKFKLLTEQLERMEAEKNSSQAFWEDIPWEQEEAFRQLTIRQGEAVMEYTACCLEWYEIYSALPRYSWPAL